jgi:hypothetical protein
VGVVTEANATHPGNPIPLAMDAELVEVHSGPPHGDLEDVGQISNGANKQKPPDHRTDVE